MRNGTVDGPGDAFASVSPARQQEIALYRGWAYAQGGVPLHRMSADVTALLAQPPYNLYTTVEPREPGLFGGTPVELWKTFRREAYHTRALNQIAHNLDTAAYHDPYLGPLVRMGRAASYIAASLGDITSVRGEGVHVEDKVYANKEFVDGRVVADSMSFGVPTESSADRVSVALQFLLRNSHNPFIIRQYTKNTQRYVRVGNLSEHDIRAVERDLGAWLAKEDAEQRSTILPPYKARFAEWKERGETFLPTIERRQLGLVAAFRTLEDGGNIHATYNVPGLSPWTGKDILGTCPAPALQAARSIMNGMIRSVFPAGSSRNVEQDPIKERRLQAERNVVLTRASTNPLGHNPPDSRTLTYAENLAITRDEALRVAKENPVQTLSSIAVKIAGAGLSTLAELGVPAVVSLYQGASVYREDHKAWQSRLDALAGSRARVRTALRDLTARHVQQYPERPFTEGRLIVPILWW